eukprot:GGOE01023613.1.p1 GENE.GGOE01023613.1~~GGOE01023613.1.p1  ORF type:complete len:561 (+),score=97.09 GGOE01023613.1:47-1684(+)
MSEMRRLLPLQRRPSAESDHPPDPDLLHCSGSNSTRFHVLVLALFILMVFLAGPSIQLSEVDHWSRPFDSAIARGQRVTLPAPPYPSIDHDRPSYQITKPFHTHAGDVTLVQPSVARENVHSHAVPSDFGPRIEGSDSGVRSATIFVMVLLVIVGVLRHQPQRATEQSGMTNVVVPIHLKPKGQQRGDAAPPLGAQGLCRPTDECGTDITAPAPNAVSQMYEAMVTSIIRPSRAEYSEEELGPSLFTMDGLQYCRRDFIVVNRRGHSLCCSQWMPLATQSELLSTVIYLHGNASCRVEAMELLPHCLPRNLAVVAFDFAGCGQSGGDYISLGHFEAEDVAAVVDALRKQPTTGHFVLWGRSMGAVTALFCASGRWGLLSDADGMSQAVDCQDVLAGVVVDSAFTSLRDLSQELVRSGQLLPFPVPGWLVSAGLWVIGRTVQQRAGFDIACLTPITSVPAARVPCLFAHAVEDRLIPAEHSRQLYNSYGGPKRFVVFQGDHNTLRPQAFLAAAANFTSSVARGDAEALEAVRPPTGQRPQFEVVFP